MRTDGLQMSNEAVQDIRSTVQDVHGEEYLPDKPRMYKCAVFSCMPVHIKLHVHMHRSFCHCLTNAQLM